MPMELHRLKRPGRGFESRRKTERNSVAQRESRKLTIEVQTKI